MDYNIKKANVINNNINIKCKHLINILGNIIYNEPISINNYTNTLVYRKMDTKCCKCNNNAEYYLNAEKIFCWKHSQYILHYKKID
jgi:hypothetical protein